MIQMTRMRLINWHNFVDNLIDFKKVTYLIGVNAVGKTTIMDAIRYCLTTNKDFNTAGNKKSGRSLQGSVHGKQRAQEVYLRPGHTVTYIGVEFYDDREKQNFVITARVESEDPKTSLKQVSQTWHLTKYGHTLEELPFLQKEGGKYRPSSKEEFKLPEKQMEKAPNQKEARRRICKILGIGDSNSTLGRKFSEVFHMGTSLEDIADIRHFIYTYILPEPEMDMEFLQGDMRELNHLEETLLETQKREELLQDVVDCFDRAEGFKKQQKINEVLLAQLEVRELKERSDNAAAELEKIAHILKECERKRTGLEEQLQNAKKDQEDAIREIADNSENQALSYLKKEAEKVSFYLLEEEKKKQQLQETGQMLLRIIRGIEQIPHSDLLLEGKQLLSIAAKMKKCLQNLEDEDLESEEKKRSLSNLQIHVKNFEQLLKEEEAKLRIGIASSREKMAADQKLLARLREGRMNYPRGVEEIREAINGEFRARGLQTEARVLCELLYMKEEEWQESAESFLGGSRFHILVEPKYYSAAKAIFIKHQDHARFTALIDTVRLFQDMERMEIKPKKGALSEKIGSENPYAKQYVDFLSGDVICCEKEEELENNKRSITKDLLRYQSYGLYKMRKTEPFIGMDAGQKQKSKMEEMVKDEVAYYQQTLELLEQIEELYKETGRFLYGRHFELLAIGLDALQKEQELLKKQSALQQEIREYEQNPLLLTMFNKKERCEQVIKELSGQQIDIESDRKGAQQRKERLLALSKEIGEKRKEAEEAYDRICRKQAAYLQEALEQLESTKKNIRDWKAAIEAENLKIQNEVSLFEQKELIWRQQKYKDSCLCDYPLGMEGEEKYRLAYANLVNIDLEKYKEELRRAKERCKERFRKEILFHMKDDIAMARAQFRSLNQVMEKLSYGEEHYRFEIRGSSDPEFQEFYHIIMDKKNEQIGEDNEIAYILSTQSAVYEEQVEEFMSRILSDMEDQVKKKVSGEERTELSLSKYVDYRTYLDYDIIVKNSVTGLEVPLSKVSADGSGGENQAPFYVAICASFLQIYDQRENSVRLILLDEAFNKMTSDRIEPMMQMFEGLGMQLVLISTVEKCSSIYPYCDITYSIIKSGAKNAVAKFERGRAS